MLKTNSNIVYDNYWKSRYTKYNAYSYGHDRLTSVGQVVSFGHERPYGRRHGDNGGAFQVVKTEYFVSPWVVNYPLFTGSVLPGTASTGTGDAGLPKAGDFSLLSDSKLDSNGSTFIARAAPTNPTAGLAEFLGDARQGLPSISGLQLLREKSRYLKGSGSEYLNVEFGWKPLVSDLRKFAFAAKNAHKIIAQYRKDSGVKIRRRSAFPTVTAAVQWNGKFNPRPIEFNQYGYGSFTSTYSHDAWFAGAFRYFLPVDDTMMGKIALAEAEANKLLGLRLTPDVVWELEPWSWAVDWFSNVGDIMKNISAFSHDGLVLEYGYSMASTVRTTEKVAKWSFYSWGQNDGAASLRTVETSKQRRPATPYGFGADLTALTSRQSAILVALGLSKGL